MPSSAFDVVIRSGRVLDPESGLDAVRDVAITGGSIAALSSEPLLGDSSWRGELSERQRAEMLERLASDLAEGAGVPVPCDRAEEIARAAAETGGPHALLPPQQHGEPSG